MSVWQHPIQDSRHSPINRIQVDFFETQIRFFNSGTRNNVFDNCKYKKSWIPTAFSESVNQRSTDNTMTKGKSKKDSQWSTKHFTEN